MFLQTKLYNECRALIDFDGGRLTYETGVRLAGYDSTELSMEDVARFLATSIKYRAKTWVAMYDASSPIFHTNALKETAQFLRAIAKEMTHVIKGDNIWLVKSSCPNLCAVTLQEVAFDRGWDKPWNAATFAKNDYPKFGNSEYITRARYSQKDKELKLTFSESPSGAIAGYREDEYRMIDNALRERNFLMYDISYRNLYMPLRDIAVDDVICNDDSGDVILSVWAATCRRASENLRSKEKGEVTEDED